MAYIHDSGSWDWQGRGFGPDGYYVDVDTDGDGYADGSVHVPWEQIYIPAGGSEASRTVSFAFHHDYSTGYWPDGPNNIVGICEAVPWTYGPWTNQSGDNSYVVNCVWGHPNCWDGMNDADHLSEDYGAWNEYYETKLYHSFTFIADECDSSVTQPRVIYFKFLIHAGNGNTYYSYSPQIIQAVFNNSSLTLSTNNVSVGEDAGNASSNIVTNNVLTGDWTGSVTSTGDWLRIAKTSMAYLGTNLISGSDGTSTVYFDFTENTTPMWRSGLIEFFHNYPNSSDEGVDYNSIVVSQGRTLAFDDFGLQVQNPHRSIQIDSKNSNYLRVCKGHVHEHGNVMGGWAEDTWPPEITEILFTVGIEFTNPPIIAVRPTRDTSVTSPNSATRNKYYHSHVPPFAGWVIDSGKIVGFAYYRTHLANRHGLCFDWKVYAPASEATVLATLSDDYGMVIKSGGGNTIFDSRLPSMKVVGTVKTPGIIQDGIGVNISGTSDEGISLERYKWLPYNSPAKHTNSGTEGDESSYPFYSWTSMPGAYIRAMRANEYSNQWSFGEGISGHEHNIADEHRNIYDEEHVLGLDDGYIGNEWLPYWPFNQGGIGQFEEDQTDNHAILCAPTIMQIYGAVNRYVGSSPGYHSDGDRSPASSPVSASSSPINGYSPFHGPACVNRNFDYPPSDMLTLKVGNSSPTQWINFCNVAVLTTNSSAEEWVPNWSTSHLNYGYRSEMTVYQSDMLVIASDGDETAPHTS